MRRETWRAWLAVALGAALAGGCERSASRQLYPPDPLLDCRKPVEGERAKAEPALVAWAEPAAPAPPREALASAPVPLRPDGTPGLAARPSPRVLDATPAARPSTSGVPAQPAVRRRAGGTPERP